MSVSATMPAGFTRRPIGTTAIGVQFNHYARRRDMAFVATHWEKISGGVRPRSFHGATKAEAQARAEEYDRQRKAKFAEWRGKKVRGEK